MKEEWFRDFRPKRDYGVYASRREKEIAGLPITQADSDYYIRKKRNKARQARTKAKTVSKLREAPGVKTAISKPVSAAGPSIQPTVPLAVRSARPPSPSTSLDSVLDSDHGMSTKSNTLRHDDNDDDVGKVQVQVKKVKRKHRALSASSTSPTARVGVTKTMEEGASTKRLRLRMPPTPVTSISESFSASTRSGSRLAGMGKISKRKEPDLSGIPTFGQPEPGILDSPLSAPPTVVQQQPVGHEPATESAIILPKLPIIPSPPEVSAAVHQPIPENDHSQVPEAAPATRVSDGVRSAGEPSALRNDQALSSRTLPITPVPQVPQSIGKEPVIDMTNRPETSTPPSSLSHLPRKAKSTPTNEDVVHSPTLSAAVPHGRARSSDNSKISPVHVSGLSSAYEAPPVLTDLVEFRIKLSPTPPKIPPSQRGPYVQGKRIVLLDDHPEVRLPWNRNEPSHSGKAAQQDSTISETARTTQPLPVVPNLQPKPKSSAYTPRIPLSNGMTRSIPTHPSAWNVKEAPQASSRWAEQFGVSEWPKSTQFQMQRPPSQSISGPGSDISQFMAARAFSPVGWTGPSPLPSVAQ